MVIRQKGRSSVHDGGSQPVDSTRWWTRGYQAAKVVRQRKVAGEEVKNATMGPGTSAGNGDRRRGDVDGNGEKIRRGGDASQDAEACASRCRSRQGWGACSWRCHLPEALGPGLPPW